MQQIVILGRGLIGGSIELAIRERQPAIEVTALDRGDDLSSVEAADLVVLSAPVRANLTLAATIRTRLAPGALLTDTGSTKAAIHAAAAGIRFIGGHPIAGSAIGGRDRARADLFAGRPWVLTRNPDTSPEDEARIGSFVGGLGAHPHWMDAEAHDRLFALLSHLPQLTVSALMAVIARAVDGEGMRLAGNGLLDSTRLASSPPEIWADIVATNRAAVRDALDALIAALTSLRNDDSGDALARTFELAAQGRARLQDRP